MAVGFVAAAVATTVAYFFQHTTILFKFIRLNTYRCIAAAAVSHAHNSEGYTLTTADRKKRIKFGENEQNKAPHTER